MKARSHPQEHLPRGAAKSRRRSEFRRILLWSGLCNLVLTSVFLGTMYPGFTGLFGPAIQTSKPAPHRLNDPLAMSRAWRSDLETKAAGTRLTDERKGPLALTRIEAEPAASSGDFLGDTALEIAPADLEIAPADAGVDPAFSQPVPAEEARGLRAAPVLRKNLQSGKLEIGSFTPLTFPGSAEECLEFGHSMLEFADSSPDILDVLISTNQITIAKICAANGSIVITCRNEEITLSPRKTRVDDRCAG